MVGALFGLFVGLLVGFALGRRQVRPKEPEPDNLSIAAGSAVTKKGKKVGLTEESFQPADDILTRMHEAWARGDELHPEEVPPAPLLDPALEEKTHRVLARLQGVVPGQGDPTMPQEPAPEAAPSGETLSDVVNDLTAAYGDDLRFDGGELHCAQCGQTHDTKAAEVEQVRRFEGPSDPADEAIVLGLRCPHCGAGGVLVSAYGPDADPSLAEAFTYLASRARHS